MFTKLSNTTTLAANKTTAQTLLEVGKIDAGLDRAVIKSVTIDMTTTDTSSRIPRLEAVNNNGDTIRLALCDAFILNTASAFLFEDQITLDSKKDGLRKLQLAIDDLTSDKTYTSTAIINYE